MNLFVHATKILGFGVLRARFTPKWKETNQEQKEMKQKRTQNWRNSHRQRKKNERKRKEKETKPYWKELKNEKKLDQNERNKRKMKAKSRKTEKNTKIDISQIWVKYEPENSANTEQITICVQCLCFGNVLGLVLKQIYPIMVGEYWQIQKTSFCYEFWENGLTMRRVLGHLLSPWLPV